MVLAFYRPSAAGCNEAPVSPLSLLLIRDCRSMTLLRLPARAVLSIYRPPLASRDECSGSSGKSGAHLAAPQWTTAELASGARPATTACAISFAKAVVWSAIWPASWVVYLRGII